MVEIYNHYVRETPITFDIEPVTVAQREPWFAEHTASARHQLFVAEEAGRVIGFAGTGKHRDRAAYDTTAETTIYCAPDCIGRGVGAMLYRALFESLTASGADLHRLLAGITLPNDASVALHHAFGFTDVGVFRENGRKFDRYWDVIWMERPLKLP
jgi:phosphinothricin acetyltransferase